MRRLGAFRLKDGLGQQQGLPDTMDEANHDPDLTCLSLNDSEQAHGSEAEAAAGSSKLLSADKFLYISIKSANNLRPGNPVPGSTCDPYVHVTLRNQGVRRPLLDWQTRVLQENEFPIWEESRAVALDHVARNAQLTLRVLDLDLRVGKSVIGQVTLRLSDVLAREPWLEQELLFEQPLSKWGRQGQGTLVFGITFVPKAVYRMPSLRRALCDPARVGDTLAGHRLHIHLESVRGLEGLDRAPQLVAAGLQVEFSLCGSRVRRPLGGQLLAGEVHPPGGLELELELGEAFREAHRLPRQDSPQVLEFGDVSMRLLAGQDRELASTQVPIWDVPLPEASPETASGGAGQNAAESVASTVAGDGSRALAAPSAPRKCYARRMHQSHGCLVVPPTAVLSMRIVRVEVAKTPATSGDAAAASTAPVAGGTVAASGGGGATPATGGQGSVDFDAPDVPCPAEPLPPLPPFGGTPCGSYEVPLGPHALCRAIFGPDAPATARAAEAEHMADVRCEEWAPSREPGALFVRRMWYTVPHPLRRDARVQVEHEQKMLVKSDAGFVVVNKVTPDAPAIGKCVHILTRVEGHHAGPGKSRLMPAVKTDWFENGLKVMPIKPFVNADAPKTSRRYFDRLHAELLRLAQVQQNGDHLPPAAAPAAAAAAASGPGHEAERAAAPPVSASVARSPAAAAAGGSVLLPHGGTSAPAAGVPVVWVLAGLLVLVLGVLLRVFLELQRSSRALEVLMSATAAGAGTVDGAGRR